MNNKIKKNKKNLKKKSKSEDGGSCSYDKNLKVKEEVVVKTEQVDSDDNYYETMESTLQEHAEVYVKKELYSSTDEDADDDDDDDYQSARNKQKMKTLNRAIEREKNRKNYLEELLKLQQEKFELKKKYYALKIKYLEDQNDVLDERCNVITRLADQDY